MDGDITGRIALMTWHDDRHALTKQHAIPGKNELEISVSRKEFTRWLSHVRTEYGTMLCVAIIR